MWLLLPLAAVSGWLAARFEYRRNAAKQLTCRRPISGPQFPAQRTAGQGHRDFHPGARGQLDTVETHLALGNLFRRRGEVERAIRVHQNLIARPTLDKEQRSQALLELGQDYFKAGLFDRAENLFLELAEIRAHSEQALTSLRHIYQQEKEWEKAANVTRKLARVSGRNLDTVIAHYYCELAEQVFAKKNIIIARAYVKQAFDNDPRCLRASILLGDIEAAEGNDREAIQAWRQVEEQDAHYLGEVAGRIAEGFRRLKDEQGLYDYFRTALQRYGGVALALTFADIIRQRDGVDAAQKFVVDWLRRKPGVHGLHRLLALNLEKAKDSARADLLLLKGIIEELRAQHLGYACGECGFKGKSLHWQCPGCNRWNTIKPVQEY